MQKTKHGIPYVESTDYREDFPEHMKLMAEAIDLLFDEVFRRIDEAENILALLKEQENEYENGFNDAMSGKQELMYEGTDGKWHKKDW